MKSEIYVILAHRNGDKNDHSYVVTFSRKESRARAIASKHCSDRGRKYSCVVYKLTENTIHDANEIIFDTGCYITDK